MEVSGETSVPYSQKIPGEPESWSWRSILLKIPLKLDSYCLAVCVEW